MTKSQNQFPPGISSKKYLQIITLGPHKWCKTQPTPHSKPTQNWITFAFVIPTGSLHGVVNHLKMILLKAELGALVPG